VRDLKSKEIVGICKQYNFWTWAAQKHVDLIPVTDSDGVYFWDEGGKKYLDFNSMVMCVNAGHGNQYIKDAICKEVQRLPYAGPHMATQPRAVLGELLEKITPDSIHHFLFTLGGAEANENAIKLARAVTGRHKILAGYRSYHGATAGAIALTGDPRRLAWEPNLMSGVVHFNGPYLYRNPFHSKPGHETEDFLNHLEEIIQFEGPSTIAGIILETVIGTNGVLIPPDGYLPGVRDICTRYGIQYIADEVMTGFGRTGKWFAVDHWDVQPDIMTMAKGLTSGYAPLGAVGMSNKIVDFFKSKSYQSGLTYNGHPLSLAAAIANIEVMENEGMIDAAAERGKTLTKELKKLQRKHPCIGDVRSLGLLGGIELVRDEKTKEPLAPYNDSSDEMKFIHKRFNEAGLYAKIHWHIILIIPPLIISDEELLQGLKIIDEVLSEVDEMIK
jgi:taurine---2-oxoglutarate transaminase